MVKLADPNAPKRPMTGYFMWMAAGNRARIMKEHNLQPKEFTKAVKICSEQWNNLPADEKATFVNKSKAQMEKYKVEFAKYKQTSEYAEFQKLKTEQKFKKIGKMKRPKDPNAPKRALSAYFLFLKEKRVQHPNLSMKDLSVKCGKEWSDLNEAGKKRFVDVANEEKKKYTELLEAYMKTASYSDFQEELKAFRTKKKQQKSKLLKTMKGSDKKPKKKKKKKMREV